MRRERRIDGRLGLRGQYIGRSLWIVDFVNGLAFVVWRTVDNDLYQSCKRWSRGGVVAGVPGDEQEATA